MLSMSENWLLVGWACAKICILYFNQSFPKRSPRFQIINYRWYSSCIWSREEACTSRAWKVRRPQTNLIRHPRTEIIQRVIEDQAFSPSCGLFTPPPPPPSPVSKLDWRLRIRLRKRDNLLTGVGGQGCGGGPNLTTRESLVLYKSFNTLCSRYSEW